MTIRECAIVMAYTGTTMLCGSKLHYFYDYVDEISNGKYGFDMGAGFYADKIKELSKKDFIELCKHAK